MLRTKVERIGASPRGQARPLLLMSANSTWNILHFRMGLVKALQSVGYRIAVAAPPDEVPVDLVDSEIQFMPLPMSAGGTSPVRDAALLGRYWLLMRRLRPHAFLGFTAKPNIYGSIAARLLGIPIINNLTGLGTAFIHGGRLERIVASLYRMALRRSEAVFFHNPDDRDLFVGRGLVPQGKTDVIPGSGIDLQRFLASPPPAHGDALTFLFVGRLLWEKGVREFAEAAHMVRQQFPRVRFKIIGSYADDKRAIPRTLVESWVRAGDVEYLGTSTDIRPHFADADCVVLPSWREGLPRVLLEAAAMGRPALASDAPGCRHAVIDEVTGFLFEARSSEALAAAINRFIGMTHAEREAMGLRARVHAEEQFGIQRVWYEYLTVLGRIGGRLTTPSHQTVSDQIPVGGRVE